MQIEFVGKHVALADGLRNEVEQRLAPAGRFLNEPVEVRVVLESGGGEKHLYAADVHVSHRAGNLRARAERPDLVECVAEATAAIVEQARRRRQKRVDRRRRAQREATPRRDDESGLISPEP